MKALFPSSDYASFLVSSDLRSLVSITEFTVQSVRRDEVARLYGVLLKIILNRMNDTFGLKVR